MRQTLDQNVMTRIVGADRSAKLVQVFGQLKYKQTMFLADIIIIHSNNNSHTYKVAV